MKSHSRYVYFILHCSIITGTSHYHWDIPGMSRSYDNILSTSEHCDVALTTALFSYYLIFFIVKVSVSYNNTLPFHRPTVTVVAFQCYHSDVKLLQ